MQGTNFYQNLNFRQVKANPNSRCHSSDFLILILDEIQVNFWLIPGNNTKFYRQTIKNEIISCDFQKKKSERKKIGDFFRLLWLTGAPQTKVDQAPAEFRYFSGDFLALSRIS
jgi:hypothetical protein